MPAARRKATVVASTGGTNAKGEPVIAPNSVLVCREEEDAGPRRFYHRLVVDSVRFKLNSIWDRMLAGVTLPTELIFKHVEFEPAMIRHWLNCNEADLGGLMFPGTFIDVESKAPRIRILKRGPTRAKSASMHADLSLHLFRREIGESPALQPFDPAVWDLEEAYDVWCFMHEEVAVAMEEECDSHRGRSQLPRGACLLFRRMMHTHFADFGWVFSRKIWEDFGLGRMVGKEDCFEFMRGMLVGMFLKYNTSSSDEPPPSVPPLYSPATVGSCQRVCAKCLVFKLGSGQMMRCPCREVYYCSKECQLGDWKVHKAVCGEKKKKHEGRR